MIEPKLCPQIILEFIHQKYVYKEPLNDIQVIMTKDSILGNNTYCVYSLKIIVPESKKEFIKELLNQDAKWNKVTKPSKSKIIEYIYRYRPDLYKELYFK